MTVRDQVCVITGAGSGIGRALAERFTAEGAQVLGADLKPGPGLFACDVTREPDLAALIEEAERRFGRPVDLFASNAGIAIDGGPEVLDADWHRIWEINVMAHVRAARLLLPKMLARGSGTFLQTVSAAGLLTSIGTAPYAVTKHAALAFAEWLSISYAHKGIRVFALCPQGVRTAMLDQAASTGSGRFLLEGSISAEDCATAVVAGLESERFLILPHPEVAQYFRNKANDYDRWIAGLRKLQARAGVNEILGV